VAAIALALLSNSHAHAWECKVHVQVLIAVFRCISKCLILLMCLGLKLLLKCNACLIFSRASCSFRVSTGAAHCRNGSKLVLQCHAIASSEVMLDICCIAWQICSWHLEKNKEWKIDVMSAMHLLGVAWCVAVSFRLSLVASCFPRTFEDCHA